MADRVRLGVIGCGVISQYHLRAAQGWPTIALAAVADLREEAARQTAQAFNIPRVYGDARALLADRDVDAVILALPTAARTPLVLEALAAGKHVLIEKPVACHADEVRAMIARRGDRVAACCSSRHRFLASARAAADFLAEEPLGDLRVIRCRCLTPAGEPPKSPPPAWRVSRRLNGGGILANWGPYDLDYLLGLLGWRVRPRQVLAQTWPVPPVFADRVAPGSDAETHFAALVRCAGAEVIAFERGEFTTTAADAAWQIIGDRGSLRLHMLPGTGTRLYHDQASSGAGVTSRVLWEGDEPWQTIHEGPVRDFADAIVQGRRPMTGLEESLVIQQIADAIYASAETGQAVDIA